MAQWLLLAHLLGDYQLQGNLIARWKTRSLIGVLVHGGIVTGVTLVCAVLGNPAWWPYALLIGLSHTVIDILRARVLRITDPTLELILYLLDQLAHLSIIALVAAWEALSQSAGPSAPAWWSPHQQTLTAIAGYLLLAQPTWVLLRLFVRGVWGAQVSPPLGSGKKYGPILERLLIATGVLFGQLYLVPLVLLPRWLAPARPKAGRDPIDASTCWQETILSILIAIIVGWALRTL